MKLDYPATSRNRDPILEVLRRVLSSQDARSLLEVGSGSGQHALYFASALANVVWHPSDPEEKHLSSIKAWAEEARASGTRLENLRPPVQLDATSATWDVPPVDALFCANVIHISPWDVTLGLAAGAARVVRPGGNAVLYGPFKRDGQHTSESNVRFEGWLKSLDERNGVRDMEDVEQVFGANGFVLTEVVPMPANNFSLIFSKSPT